MEATWRGSLGLLVRWGGCGGLLTETEELFLLSEIEEPAGRTRGCVSVYNK